MHLLEEGVLIHSLDSLANRWERRLRRRAALYRPFWNEPRQPFELLAHPRYRVQFVVVL